MISLPLQISSKVLDLGMIFIKSLLFDGFILLVLADDLGEMVVPLLDLVEVTDDFTIFQRHVSVLLD